jgi:hypothetical protein
MLSDRERETLREVQHRFGILRGASGRSSGSHVGIRSCG